MSLDKIDHKTERTAVTVIERPIAPAKPTQACLVMIYGSDLGKRFPLEPEGGKARELVVGRSSQSEINIDEESVSRRHALFHVHDDGRVQVRDLDSTNGTYVNDRPVKEQLLTDGDMIKIGRAIFKYLTSSNIEAQYHEEIYRLTTTDGLTSVYNKRYFLEALDREMGRCFRYTRPLTLVMIDIDHFKKINDTHGHLAGDTVLKQVAGLLVANVRKEDIFARYGGEEFGLILPEVTLDGAHVLSEKLRALIAEGHFAFEGQQIPVTISIGIAALPTESIGLDGFIGKADAALYDAKNTGRNRVCLAPG